MQSSALGPGSAAAALELRLLRGSWGLPRLGIEPMSPALAGGFLLTMPHEVLVYYDRLCLSLENFAHLYSKVKEEVAPSCLTLCGPTDYTVHGVL